MEGRRMAQDMEANSRQVTANQHDLINFIFKQTRQYQLLILDDIAYVTKDQAETSVLFELIAARYERRSLLITANQPFGEWGKVFTDKTMTLAAVDRLVHHATILEMNVENNMSLGSRAVLETHIAVDQPRGNSAGCDHRNRVDDEVTISTFFLGFQSAGAAIRV
jgi:IstB-like ATP binding protein